MGTLKRQTLKGLVERSTSCQEASPASRTASQESSSARKTPGISGLTCAAQYISSTRHGLSLKMFTALLPGRKEWYSRRCMLSWKQKVTKSGRSFFQLQVSTRHTGGTGSSSSLIKTPTAMDGKVTSGKSDPKTGNSGTLAQELMSGYKATWNKLGLLPTPTTAESIQNIEQFEKRMQKYPNGTTVPNLATQVYQLFRTRNRKVLKEERRNVAALLPTPTASSDAKGGCTRKDPGRQRSTLAHTMHGFFGKTGRTSRLNPLFVEEMMGFPKYWTLAPFLKKRRSAAGH